MHLDRDEYEQAEERMNFEMSKLGHKKRSRRRFFLPKGLTRDYGVQSLWVASSSWQEPWVILGYLGKAKAFK